MHFSIITPTAKRTMMITWLEVETLTGNLIIEPGYAPSIIVLKPESNLTVGFANNTTEIFAKQSGILHITRESAQFLVNV